MVEFDRLPATSRSLVLTKLTLEMVSKNCKNIFQLARQRNQSVHEVWRDVCRKTGQPLCETPHHVMTPSFYAKAVASLEPIPAKSLERSEGVTNVATPSRAKKVSSSSGLGLHAQKRRAMLAIGLGGMVAVAITFFTVSSMKSQGSPQSIRPVEAVRVSVAKPDSTIRADDAKPSPGPVNVPPPQGTIKRMDAISKAFSNR